MKEINLPSIAKDKLLKYSQGKLFLLNQLIKNDIFPKINWIDLVDYLKENKYIKNLFELCPINSDDVTNTISNIFIYPQLFPTLYDIAKNNNDINNNEQSSSESEKSDSDSDNNNDDSNNNSSNSDSENKSNSSSSNITERKKN